MVQSTPVPMVPTVVEATAAAAEAAFGDDPGGEASPPLLTELVVDALNESNENGALVGVGRYVAAALGMNLL